MSAVRTSKSIELVIELERWDPSGVAPRTFFIFAMHNDLHPSIRAWLLGLLDLRLVDRDAVMDLPEELIREVEEAAPRQVRVCVIPSGLQPARNLLF